MAWVLDVSSLLSTCDGRWPTEGGHAFMILLAQGHKIMLASVVTVSEVGGQIFGIGSVVGRLWEGAKINARTAEVDHVLK